jgi:hypothetical protein
MANCRICNVALDGFLSKVAKVLFKTKPSTDNYQICSKCAAKEKNCSAPNSQDSTYQCQICSRTVNESHALEHIKAEEYLIDLIKKDHPQWQHKGHTCKECIDYYKKLIKDAQI